MTQIRESGAGLEPLAPGDYAANAWDMVLAGIAADAGAVNLGRMQSLVQGSAGKSIVWDEVLRLADHHGTTCLLYQNLLHVREALPAAVLTSLRKRYELNVHKSLFLARELIRVLDCVEAIGAEAIAYKGIVLAEVYYGDMALRHVGDMDFFVRSHDVMRIKNAVQDLGYTPRVATPEEAEEDYIAAGYEWTFDSPAGKNLLELQWALQPHFYAVDFDMAGMFQRAVKVTVAGSEVRTPCAEDLLLVLAIHAAKHVWGRLIWLCDIEQILKRENLNWESVQSGAREMGVERILHVTLLLASRFLGTAIPVPIESAVLTDRAARVFADQIAVAVAAETSYEEQQISYFRLMMRLRERKMDRLRFLSRLAFTPGPGEWQAVRLPKSLFPLYRMVRLARLASRLARG